MGLQKHNPKVVTAFFCQAGIMPPEFEYVFHPTRKWRFDVAWPLFKLALEVDGGIFIHGGHNRGAQMLKTWEKENEAVARGWRILRCQPSGLLKQEMIDLVKRAANL
jgi:hypothetical protein